MCGTLAFIRFTPSWAKPFGFIFSHLSLGILCIHPGIVLCLHSTNYHFFQKYALASQEAFSCVLFSGVISPRAYAVRGTLEEEYLSPFFFADLPSGWYILSFQASSWSRLLVVAGDKTLLPIPQVQTFGA